MGRLVALVVGLVVGLVALGEARQDTTTLLSKFLGDVRAGALGVSRVIASVRFGAAPATAGAVRLSNNTGVFWRNAGNSANASLVLNTSDVLVTDASVATAGSLSMYTATAVPAGGTTGAGLKMSSTANLGVFFGSGAPTLSAAQGSLYIRTDGSSTSTRLYVNTNGSTTWTSVTTGS